MLHDKIKKTVKKATKKVKKGLGSLANTIADKLVPKELAPFLPALAPLFLGPGASALTRYLVPQLLTALSTGKTQGDIDLTSQALTGIASALSDPRRFELATPTEAQAAVEGIDPNAIIPGSEQIGFGKLDPTTGEFFYDGGDLLLGPDGAPLTLGDLPANTFDPSTGQLIQNVPGVGGMPQNIVVVPGSGTSVVGFGPGQVDPAFAQAIGSGSPAVPAQPLTRVDTGLNALKTAANRTLDFMQGANEATRFGEPILDDAGNPVLVRDAGFLQNLPRRTVQQGILSVGPIMSAIERSEEEQAAMLAEQQAEQQAALDARDALTNFYFGLADPENRFGTLPIFAAEGGIMNTAPGMPQGMQVDGRNGTFIPMGVKEKADDVPAMLSKNEFVMTADAVRGMGGGDVNAGAQRMYDLMNSLEARA
jgi:hypothetical protein